MRHLGISYTHVRRDGAADLWAKGDGAHYLVTNAANGTHAAAIVTSYLATSSGRVRSTMGGFGPAGTFTVEVEQLEAEPEERGAYLRPDES